MNTLKKSAFILITCLIVSCSTSEKEEMKEKYEIQLQLYKDALERITGKVVSKCILYLFYKKMHGQT